MSLKIIITAVFFSFYYNGLNASDTSIYKDKSAPIELRINDLLKRMTLEEKILQMNQWVYGQNDNPNNIEKEFRATKPELGSLLYRSTNPVYRNQIQRKAVEETRLGIPMIFGYDVIHGFRTIFPIPLAQSCSWNSALVKQSCSISAREAWLSGINWTFSPMVDVARDPRWGRVAEGYGEDPYANSVFGVAAIEGYQGKNLADKYSLAACLKHYVGYSLSQGGRDYQYSDVSGQTLWETCLVPFEAGVKAGAVTLMSGFNDISGIPATANYYTLTKILKQDWQHDGFVISDWQSVENLILQGVAKDKKEAGAKAVNAGLEMDMMAGIYMEYLPQLVAEKKVKMEVIDEAVHRILRVKFKLGLFDNPYVDEINEKERYLTPQYLEAAKQLAAESMVLLKNNENILPLSSNIKNIAIIGPMANDSVNLMGSWPAYGHANEVITLFKGLKSAINNNTSLLYANGCNFEDNDTSGFKEARDIAIKSDAVIVCLGEKQRWSGENGIRSSIALPAIQEQLVAELFKTKKTIILVLSSGRPIELSRLQNWSQAILLVWQPGTTGGEAFAEIVTGKINPSGKLSITFPYSTGQIPMYYNVRQSARPYIGQYQDIPKEPLYPFGYGLSYTSFRYSEIKLSSPQIKKQDTLIAEIVVTNTGKYSGKEAVLWFVYDPVASVSRPIKELKYFEKKEIGPGKHEVYKFSINPMRDLSFVDSQGNKFLEPGEFYLLVGDKKIKFELVE